MKTSNATLRGIVVAADSRQQAENLYRDVATGVSAKALVDETNSFAILSHAGADITLMNPLTGELNLVEASDDLVGGMEFLSSGSDEVVNTNYTICADGCGSHVIADDPELMKFCPACASELKDLSEEQIQEIAQAGEGDENAPAAEASDEGEQESDVAESSVEAPAIVTTGKTKEEAAEKFNDIVSAMTENGSVEASGSDIGKIYVCEGSTILTDANSTFKFSPYTGEAANELDGEALASAEDADFSVEASDEGEVQAHWYVCASDECGTHVVSSTEMPVFCPDCSSGLIEPEVEAANDEDDELNLPAVESSDDEEEYDEESDEDSEEDEDESEDEESDDEEEEESDEDESDEDESDDEESDEDFDDDNSLSVSSVTIEDEATVPVMESVSTNLLALASANGELSADKLEVAYAGVIAGEQTCIAFYEGQPVAKATAASAKRDDIFATEMFRKVVVATAKENGVHNALNELGFQPIEANVNVDEYIKGEVESRSSAQVAEAKAAFESASADYHARFMAALATAATGINTNFFKDAKNPVKGSLVAMLSSAGVQNADRLVSQAFAQHNAAYHQTLLAKACKIMEYDVNVQNELTEAVASASPDQSVASNGDDVLSIGTPVTKQPAKQVVRQEVTASAQPKKNDVDMNAVLATLGRNRRF